MADPRIVTSTMARKEKEAPTASRKNVPRILAMFFLALIFPAFSCTFFGIRRIPSPTRVPAKAVPPDDAGRCRAVLLEAYGPFIDPSNSHQLPFLIFHFFVAQRSSLRPSSRGIKQI